MTFKRSRLSHISLMLLVTTLVAVWARPPLSPITALADGDEFTTEIHSTMSVAWGDYDGDGDLDLAAGNIWTESYLYENNGGGIFEKSPIPGGPATTMSVAWGDMDGDGDLDLAVGNFEGPNYLYQNEGGALVMSEPLGIHSERTFSVAWGDYDGDGDLDLAVGNSGGVNRLYDNDGLGNLKELDGPFPLDGFSEEATTSVAWGDMDGDGDLDLAVGNAGQQNRLYRNEGDGAFDSFPLDDREETSKENTYSVAWGDMDGDGDLDLAVGNFGDENRLYENKGNGVLEELDAPLLPPGDNPDYTRSVAWGDYDGDGDLDLVVGNTGFKEHDEFHFKGQENRIYENRGDNKFVAIDDDPYLLGGYSDATMSVAWGDMDGDGDLDLAVGNVPKWNEKEGESLGENRLGINERAGFFIEVPGEPLRRHQTDDTSSMAWGDMDGDGDLDLAVGNDGTENCIYENNGGALTEVFVLDPDSADLTMSVAWGDMDGDGDLDLAVGNFEGPNQLYQNEGGVLGLYGALGNDENTASVAWGDIDGDGDLDLVIGNVGQVNRLYHNDGDGNLEEPVDDSFHLPSYTEDTYSVALGDMDGDGDLDLVVGNDRGKNRLYENRGNGVFDELDPLENLEDRTRSVAWGDMNGDGNLDLIVGNGGTRNRLYENKGDNRFEELVVFPRQHDGDFTKSVAWADIDGDGDLDLVVGNTGGENRLYRNDGLLPGSGRAFNEIPGILDDKNNSDDTYSVAWGDMDGDGDLDLAVGNAGQANRLYENTRQGRSALPNNAPTLKITAPYASTADFYAASTILTDPTIPITYTICDPEGDPVGNIAAFYSSNGGGKWYTVTSGSKITTSGLTMSPALTFDGVDDWVETRDFDINDDFTISLWINPQTITDGLAFISKQDEDGSNQILFGFYDDNDGSGVMYSFFISGTQFLGVEAATGWQHLAAVGVRAGDATTVTVYRDGQKLWQQSERVVVGDVSGDMPWVIGQDWDNVNDVITQTDFFKGQMFQVRIWDYARTQSEIQSDMYRTLTGNEPGLVAYWPFDEGEGHTVYDKTSHSNDGTIINGATGQPPKWTSSHLGIHVYQWDTSVSGFFGQSDNVVFRIRAYPQPEQSNASGGYRYYNTVPGPFQRPYASATTFPFRVRSMPVRVYSETVTGAKPISNAIVYRLPVGELDGAEPMGGAEKPFRTDSHGYLQGHGELEIGDRLVALMPVHTTVNYAGALVFDGENDYMTTTLSIDQSSASPGVTMMAWVYPDSTSHGEHLVISTDDGGYDWSILHDGDVWYVYTGQESLSTTASVDLNRWQHVAAVFEPSVGIRFYKNGQEVMTSPNIGYDTSSDNMGIGGNPRAETYFAGRIDEVRVYDHALPTADIRSAMSRLDGDGIGLMAYWDFDNPDIATTGVCEEQTGNGSVGRLVGATWVGDYRGGYTVYHTNREPVINDLKAFTVTPSGVQALTVTARHPLILFDLNVSLEWDARESPFLSELRDNLQLTSERLYDWTNGQAALGTVTIYHDKKHWLDAHVRIYASNRMRPNATLGGFVSTALTATMPITPTRVVTYGPGQIRISAEWNRFGDSDSDGDEEDWSRVLAHELGHYLLFLDDNYLGFDGDLLIMVDDCPGAMSDPYRHDEFLAYDEFHPDVGWMEHCTPTLSHQLMGRSDWATIRAFYPWLHMPATEITDPAMSGPDILPLLVTQIVDDPYPPSLPADMIASPSFELVIEDGNPYTPMRSARAFLFRGPRLVDLGGPTGSRVQALGAQRGDRVCVFDVAAGYQGCREVQNTWSSVEMQARPEWRPGVRFSSISTHTLEVSVQVTKTVPLTAPLRAQLYWAEDMVSEVITLTKDTDLGLHVGRFGSISEMVPLVGYVHVWQDVDGDGAASIGEPQAMADYALGGNPGLMASHGGLMASHGGLMASHGGLMASHGGLMASHGAPGMSADGRAMIFGRPESLEFGEDELFVLQSATYLPTVPPWLTMIGQGYWLAVSESVDVGRLQKEQVSISFHYPGSQVPYGDEGQLQLYYWDGQDGTEWQKLDAEQDTTHNLFSAPIRGTGVYAVMSSYEISFPRTGCYSFEYPFETDQPVTSALRYTEGEGDFSIVYWYNLSDEEDPWKFYSKTAPEWLNTLHTLKKGQVLRACVTGPFTLYLVGDEVGSSEVGDAINMPAIYYGIVQAEADIFTPTVGMTVTAMIDENDCGQAKVQERELDGVKRLVYSIQVLAEHQSLCREGDCMVSGYRLGCGNQGGGSLVTFHVGPQEEPMGTANWNHEQLWRLDLKPE